MESLWLAIAGCAALIGLSVVALRRVGDPLSLPLGAYCLVSAGWTMSAAAYRVTGAIEWHLVDIVLSPWIQPTALWVIVRFVGVSKALNTVIAAVAVCAGLLSAASALSPLNDALGWFEASVYWNYIYLSIAAPSVGLMIGLLVRHLRTEGRQLESNRVERARSYLLLAAIAIAFTTGVTEVLPGIDDNLRLGPVGTLATAALLTHGSMRLDLIKGATTATVLSILSAAASIAVGFTLGFTILGNEVSFAIVVAAVISVALLALIRHLGNAVGQARAQQRRFAFLGRLSDQLAHDLKNPIASIQGAAELLQEELRLGNDLSEHAEFLGLIESESRRLTDMIDRYRRVGRIEAHPATIDAKAFLLELASKPWLADYQVEVVVVGSPQVYADKELLQIALENIARNAADASEPGGRLELGATIALGQTRISVMDQGDGMDARERQLALEEFYTTKAHGTGLGLSYCARVAKAHGGGLHVKSQKGQGTTVSMTFPVAAKEKRR